MEKLPVKPLMLWAFPAQAVVVPGQSWRPQTDELDQNGAITSQVDQCHRFSEKVTHPMQNPCPTSFRSLKS